MDVIPLLIKEKKTVELKETIRIANAYLNGEGATLNDVTKAYRAFIKAHQNIEEYNIIYDADDVLAEAEEREIEISREEAVSFIEKFRLSDELLGSIGSEFREAFHWRFE